MAFPFYPFGMVLSLLFLGTAMAAFALALVALDHGAAELRGSIGAGLVRGVQAWTHGRPPPSSASAGAWPPARPTRAAASGESVEDLAGAAPIEVEHVRRSRT